MSESLEEIEIRISEESDRPYLVKWLSDEDVLLWFPMVNSVEVEDAVRIWLSHSSIGASLTVTVNKIPCAMAVIYLHTYEKLQHQTLFAIIVDPECRGKGIGTQLFERLKLDAKEKFGVELLHLEVYKGNPALRLYERLGFIEYGRHPEFLKEGPGQYRDKILMQMYL